MESIEFLFDIALIHDTLEKLEELSFLSKQLQSNDVTITQADNKIRRTIRIISSLSSEPGEKMKEAFEAGKCGKWKGLTIKKNAKLTSIPTKDFLTSLVCHILSINFSTIGCIRN